MKLKVGDIEFNLIPHDKAIGDLMTVGNFIDKVLTGGFINYDGYAHFLVTKENILYEIEGATYDIDENIIKFNKIMIVDIVTFCKALGATKVVWYNR